MVAKQLRSVIVFADEIKQSFYRASTSDLSEVGGSSTSEIMLGLLVKELAVTPQGQMEAMRLYGYGFTCCDVYSGMFDGFAAIPPVDGCEVQLVEAFRRFVYGKAYCLDVHNERMHHLCDEWKRVCLILDDAAQTDIAARLRAETARDLARILEEKHPYQTMLPFISLAMECWDVLRSYSSTYRVFVDLAELAIPSRPGLREGAGDRIALLKAVDACYLAVKNEKIQEERS